MIEVRLMRRYTVLLVVSFVIMLLVITGTMYISGTGSDRDSGRKLLGEITVYTTLPTENVTYLAEEYEKLHKIQVNFVPLSEQELEQRLREPGKADMVLADSRLLRRAAGQGWLVPYVSEHSDAVAGNLKDAGDFWIGTWYDPVVFCINRDYMQRNARLPLGWRDLSEAKGMRIGITDFLAADSSANLYFFLIAQFGEQGTLDLLKKIHPNVVQYAKYLSTPVRMAGMGEVDLTVAVQSEVLRYIDDGYPLKIIQPEEGTAYTLIGNGILLHAPHGEQARKFADWLLTDEALLVLQSNKFYFVPTNPATLAYKRLAVRNPVLFNQLADFPKEKRQELLDRWVKQVRLASDSN